MTGESSSAVSSSTVHTLFNIWGTRGHAITTLQVGTGVQSLQVKSDEQRAGSKTHQPDPKPEVLRFRVLFVCPVWFYLNEPTITFTSTGSPSVRLPDRTSLPCPVPQANVSQDTEPTA